MPDFNCPKCDENGVNPRKHIREEHPDEEFEIRGTSS